MLKETIKSVTNCPTCSSEVTVEGTTTHYYVPKNKYNEEDMIEFSKFCQTDEFECRAVNKSLLELFTYLKNNRVAEN